MTNYNDGKWHGWNGGECPVHPESVVEAQFDRGRDNELARRWVWAHHCNGSGPDIIAFRVIKEHKEPREFFAVEYDSVNLSTGEVRSIGWQQCSKDTIGATLFREVLE